MESTVQGPSFLSSGGSCRVTLPQKQGVGDAVVTVCWGQLVTMATRERRHYKHISDSRTGSILARGRERG